MPLLQHPPLTSMLFFLRSLSAFRPSSPSPWPATSTRATETAADQTSKAVVYHLLALAPPLLILTSCLAAPSSSAFCSFSAISDRTCTTQTRQNPATESRFSPPSFLAHPTPDRLESLTLLRRAKSRPLTR